MSRLFYAIVARFFWACANLIDQYITRFSGHKSMLAVMINCNVIMLPILIAAVCVFGVPVHMKPVSVMWLGAGVVANMATLYPYYLALHEDEAHNTMPLFEMIPVFVTFLAYTLFGDTLTLRQLTGAGLIIGAGFLFSWDFHRGHLRLRTLQLMVLASFCYALYLIALRYSAQRESVGGTIVCVYTGFFISSVILFTVLPEPRRLFLKSVRQSNGALLGAALMSESFGFLASLSITVAFARALRTGQVVALSGTQPFFVLLISAILGFVLPRYYRRLVWDRELKIKFLLLFVIAAGIVLLQG